MYINKPHKRAQELLDAMKLHEALEQFNKALKESPNHPDILSHRGVLYLHMNQKKNCFDDLLKAQELQPDNPYRYSSMAYARDFFGDIDGAILDYEKAIALDPEDAIAHNNLGLLHEKKGYASKAKRQFERADKIAKIENRLYDQVQTEELQTPKGEQLQPKKMAHSVPKKNSKTTIIRSIFTDRTVFKEFITFVKYGFKHPDNDQEK
jgi:Flp pilus assembly protein TadD